MSKFKKCNKCNQDKSISEFGKDSRNKDGLQGRCKKCQNERRRERYATDPVHRVKTKERQKKYNSYALTKAKRHVSEISDTYVIAELKRGTSLSTEDIRKYPELIEAKRQVIKNKRLRRCQLTT